MLATDSANIERTTSRIVNGDAAAECAVLAKNNVLAQAGHQLAEGTFAGEIGSLGYSAPEARSATEARSYAVGLGAHLGGAGRASSGQLPADGGATLVNRAEKGGRFAPAGRDGHGCAATVFHSHIMPPSHISDQSICRLFA